MSDINLICGPFIQPMSCLLFFLQQYKNKSKRVYKVEPLSQESPILNSLFEEQDIQVSQSPVSPPFLTIASY